jgi:hypothetical protein
MATLRDDIADLQSRLQEAERSAHQLPHREKHLLLVTGFMRRYLELHLELIDQVEQSSTASPPRRLLDQPGAYRNNRTAR